jgi:hypothetical protein
MIAALLAWFGGSLFSVSITRSQTLRQTTSTSSTLNQARSLQVPFPRCGKPARRTPRRSSLVPAEPSDTKIWSTAALTPLPDHHNRQHTRSPAQRRNRPKRGSPPFLRLRTRHRSSRCIIQSGSLLHELDDPTWIRSSRLLRPRATAERSSSEQQQRQILHGTTVTTFNRISCCVAQNIMSARQPPSTRLPATLSQPFQLVHTESRKLS